MSAALAHTDPTLRVHRAYVGVRKSQRARSFLPQMHALYERVCVSENLTDADDMLLHRVEAELSDNRVETQEAIRDANGRKSATIIVLRS